MAARASTAAAATATNAARHRGQTTLKTVETVVTVLGMPGREGQHYRLELEPVETEGAPVQEEARSEPSEGHHEKADDGGGRREGGQRERRDDAVGGESLAFPHQGRAEESKPGERKARQPESRVAQPSNDGERAPQRRRGVRLPEGGERAVEESVGHGDEQRDGDAGRREPAGHGAKAPIAGRPRLPRPFIVRSRRKAGASSPDRASS
jgi:hypothetical protein